MHKTWKYDIEKAKNLPHEIAQKILASKNRHGAVAVQREVCKQIGWIDPNTNQVADSACYKLLKIVRAHYAPDPTFVAEQVAAQEANSPTAQELFFDYLLEKIPLDCNYCLVQSKSRNLLQVWSRKELRMAVLYDTDKLDWKILRTGESADVLLGPWRVMRWQLEAKEEAMELLPWGDSRVA